MRKRLLLTLMLGIVLISLASATTNLGTSTQNECIVLNQVCDNCTYVNITSVNYPNRTKEILNVQMTKQGTDYNYTFCKTDLLGIYNYNTFGDLDGEIKNEVITFQITEGGDTFNNSQAISLLGLIAVITLLFAISATFKKEKWKLKMFFQMMALIFAVILLNSIRIINGTSSSLAKMGNIGLVVGITILSFGIFYMLVLYTIEVFNYFKKRNIKEWDIGTE